jgi:RNA polymerase sigma-70 factor, ECF subfamily
MGTVPIFAGTAAKPWSPKMGLSPLADYVIMPEPRPDEFVTLYTRYEQKLYRYVASLLTHPSEAEDVLQETARVLWQKFAQYRPEEPFLPWACRIAHFEVLNHCQRERTRRKYFRPAVLELLADARLKHDDLFDAQSQWLDECIGKLADMDRQLVEQRYASNRTLAELATETGRTPNALYKAMQRIRRTLLTCVENGLKSEGWK